MTTMTSKRYILKRKCPKQNAFRGNSKYNKPMF